jgi:hypothetical protein
MATFTVTGTTGYTITEANAAAQQITSYNVKIGTVSGTYPQSIPVPAAAMTSSGATGNFASLVTLPPGNYFGAASAVNATGEGPIGAPFAFTIPLALPSAPSFQLA